MVSLPEGVPPLPGVLSPQGPAVLVEDHDVFDVRLVQGRARRDADSQAIAVREGLRNRTGELGRQLRTTALPAVARERGHCGIGKL